MARQAQHLIEQQRALGRYLAALRQAAGLYQVDIARAVPCHRTTVTHAEAGSQLPDTDFWEIADRIVGADGALIVRYDQLVHAKATYLAEQKAQRRARAQATAQQLTAASSPKARVDTTLSSRGMPITAYEAVETARQDAASRKGSADGLPAAPSGDGRVPRRKILKLGLAVTAVTPEVLGRVLSDAAAEAMEFTQLAGLSAVG
ncbi:MAG: helix-turn-helix domain-containing protein, partial [Gammaproteobacteria bacterium]